MGTPSRMAELLQLAGIKLDATASSREEAVSICGSILVSLGAASKEYSEAMWERELSFPSELGNGFAIPHGTDESRRYVNFDQLVYVRFSSPVAWKEETVSVCVGIASQGDGHVEILGNLADLLLDKDSSHTLLNSNDKQEIHHLLSGGVHP